MIRLAHTADWHLGHLLARHARGAEHDIFLAWFLDLLERERVDALLLCGDVFDSSNPTADALRRFYRFLADARARMPALDLVVVGGNHDSPARLEAAMPLLRAIGVTVVGALPLDADPARAVVPLTDARGDVRAYCLAVPYLRMIDLAPGMEPPDGVRARYAEVAAAAAALRRPGQALVVTGHGYLAGTRVSELSERKVLGGGQHALSTGIFPSDASYVALGHLHLVQEVGSPSVRYSGSPLPLSITERAYPHQVLLVDLEGASVAQVRPFLTPRPVPMDQVGGPDGAALDRVLAELRAYPQASADGRDPDLWPLVEVRVRTDGPTPGLRDRVDDALAGRAVRLVRLRAEVAARDTEVVEPPLETLADLAPEEVFRRRWASEHEGEPPAPLLAAFATLLDDALQGEL